MRRSYFHSDFARQVLRERQDREAARQRQMEADHQAELAVRRTMPRCPTPRCVEFVAKYGDSHLSVYVCDAPELSGGASHQCTSCGGLLIGGAWVHRCKSCRKEVAPGDLCGLFVPHKCGDCERATAEADRARGAVCSRCSQPYSRCCC